LDNHETEVAVVCTSSIGVLQSTTIYDIVESIGALLLAAESSDPDLANTI
jgi:hypothetical protein